MRSISTGSATANTTAASTRRACALSWRACPSTEGTSKPTSRTETSSSCRRWTGCSRRSEFPAHPEGGQNRQPGDGRAPAEIVRIPHALDVFVVVDVLDVEVEREQPPLEHEILVDAQV